MTQPLLSSHAACPGHHTQASELAALIDRELAPARLAATLDADAPLCARHFRRALGAPLGELLEREGKAFRSRLVEVAFQLGAGGQRQVPPELSLVVEALHTGSLIVDDIEDGSPRRRGGPSLHLVVGLPLALNAGNWLYFLPDRLLQELELEPAVELELRRAIDRAVLRCHYGQALDLGTRVGSLAQGEVPGVVRLCTRLKTGSLLELSAELGGVAGGAGPELRGALAVFGRRYGTALQMLDDASGLFHPARAQKGLEDVLHERPTWPWAWLAERLDQVSYSRLAHQAQAVGRGELEAEELTALLRRQLGSAPQHEAERELHEAFSSLSAHVPDRSQLDPLRDELERLQVAYG